MGIDWKGAQGDGNFYSLNAILVTWVYAFVKTHQMVCLVSLHFTTQNFPQLKSKQRCSGPSPKLIESESV